MLDGDARCGDVQRLRVPSTSIIIWSVSCGTHTIDGSAFERHGKNARMAELYLRNTWRAPTQRRTPIWAHARRQHRDSIKIRRSKADPPIVSGKIQSNDEDDDIEVDIDELNTTAQRQLQKYTIYPGTCNEH